MGLATMVFFSCKDDSVVVDPPTPAPTKTKINFKFSHNINGIPWAKDTIIYENLSGNQYAVTSFKYVVSDLRISNYKGDHTLIFGDNHYLINSVDTGSFTISPPDSIGIDDYSSISFFLGFLEDENVTGTKQDLDLLDANNMAWPPSKGGGYYGLQMEGRVKDSDTSSYAFDLGIGGYKLIEKPADTSYQVNEVIGSVQFSGFDVPADAKEITIEIKVNFARLFDYGETQSWGLYDIDIHPGNSVDDAVGSEILSNNAIFLMDFGGMSVVN